MRMHLFHITYNLGVKTTTEIIILLNTREQISTPQNIRQGDIKGKAMAIQPEQFRSLCPILAGLHSSPGSDSRHQLPATAHLERQQ